LAGQYYVVFQCLLALLLFFLPSILERRFRIELPNVLENLVLLFIFSSLLLGEIYGYYSRVPYWDKLLHTSSGFLTAAIGFSLIELLNEHETIALKLSPLFVAVFAFCFSMTVGVLWEFFEYGCDLLLGADMQKDRLVKAFTSTLLGGERVVVDSVSVNGIAWEGYIDIGLIDTMEDLIVNALGALVFSFFGFLLIGRRGRGRLAFLKHFLPYRKRNTDAETEKSEGNRQKNEKKKFDNRN